MKRTRDTTVTRLLILFSFLSLGAFPALGVLVSGCVHVGAAITNAPSIPDCMPGSATKPCQ